MKKLMIFSALAALASFASAQNCCPEKDGQKKHAQHEQKMVGDKEACCKSTEAKPMAKGDPGCCNAPGEPAKFKVFVSGVGYKFYGCEDSAAKARKDILAKGGSAGKVQKVTSKVKIAAL